MTQRLQWSEECRLCGQIIPAGSEAQGIPRRGGAGGGYTHPGNPPQCPSPEQAAQRKQNGKEINVRRDPDEHEAAFQRRYEVLTCKKCGHRESYAKDKWHPPVCVVTLYTPDGKPCGGTLVDDDGDEWPLGPDAPWDELHPKLQEHWERHWLRRDPDTGKFPQRPSEERLAAGASDYKPRKPPPPVEGFKRLDPTKGLHQTRPARDDIDF